MKIHLCFVEYEHQYIAYCAF